MELSEYKIKASLIYGKVFWGKQKYILYIGFLSTLLIPITTLCIFIMVGFGKMELSPNMIAPLIFSNVFSIFLFCVILWRAIFNRRVIGKIQTWLVDAIFINASARRLDLMNPKYKPYQIEVKFTFENKTQKHISSAGNPIIGYYKFFSESEKEVKILYSAKYNQVLILKD